MRRRMHLRALIVVVVGAAALLTGCGSSAQMRTQPTGRPVAGQIVGVMFDGPVLGAGVNLDRQLDLAVGSGAESLRIAVDWAAVQPYRSFSAVPAAWRKLFTSVAGVPTNFAILDRIVAAAAARRLSLLPVVQHAPGWDAQQPGTAASPPKSSAPFAAFLTALVRRYGPHGSFWAAHPTMSAMPIRMWQIWNEPNFTSYWSTQPFAPSYIRLLSAASAALKSADPAAKVVLAGFADFSWEYLAQVYRVPGARRLFDVVAIHPYTAQPAGVLTILQRARAVMDRFGDRTKPILATELTWPSSEGKAPPQFGVSTTEAQQAQRLARVMPLLVASRKKLGLMGFYWYTWMGNESPALRPYAFDYAGLLKYVSGTITAKPALQVFKQWALRIEGCRRKLTGESCAS